MGILNKLLALFFPSRCLQCGKSGSVNDSGLCPACAELPSERLYRVVALHTSVGDRTLECYAPMRYQGPFRSALRRFKFQNETSLANPIAGLMVSVMDRTADYDCIVPVPISGERMQERGYNQSALLVKAISGRTKIPHRKLLVKTRNNQTQHRLSAQERESNVRDVYRAENCSGLRVLLVDDIVTTGATVQECAKMLYEAGADHVSVLCSALVQ